MDKKETAKSIWESFVAELDKNNMDLDRDYNSYVAIVSTFNRKDVYWQEEKYDP